VPTSQSKKPAVTKAADEPEERAAPPPQPAAAVADRAAAPPSARGVVTARPIECEEPLPVPRSGTGVVDALEAEPTSAPAAGPSSGAALTPAAHGALLRADPLGVSKNESVADTSPSLDTPWTETEPGRSTTAKRVSETAEPPSTPKKKRKLRPSQVAPQQPLIAKWKATLARRMRLGEWPSMAELGTVPKLIAAWHVAKGRGRRLLAATPTFLEHLQVDKAGQITAPKHINHLMRLVADDDPEEDLVPRLARIGTTGSKVAWYSMSAANEETLKRIASGVADLDAAIGVSQATARTDRLTARVLEDAGFDRCPTCQMPVLNPDDAQVHFPASDEISVAKKQRVSFEQLEAELSEERARRAEAEARRLEAEARLRAAQQQEDELLLMRSVALRQYFECLRMAAAKPGTTTWNFKLARSNLVAGVIEHFRKLSTGANLTGPVHLWRNTNVSFQGELGVDEGGLTAEMHALFWHEVCQPAHRLFEPYGDDEVDGRYLPKRGAPLDQLENVGRVLLKSIIDDHPTGALLDRFLFLHLRNRICFDTERPREALQMLTEFAPALAKQWQWALEASDDELGWLTLDMFHKSLGDGAVTRDNVAAAVVAGCRRVLLAGREEELKALERGFTFCGKVDLTLQLAPIPAEQMLLMVRGKDELSAEDLLGCFRWPEADEATAGAAAHLRTVITCRLDQKARRLLLRWCTARSTLPVDGLKEKVSIYLLIPESQLSPDEYFPRSHTCYPSIELPAYSSADVLLQRLQVALVELAHGGGFGLA